MKLSRNPFVRLGAAALAVLVMLRLLWSGFDSRSLVVWALSFAWPLLICLGIAAEKGAALSRVSPWRALALITTLLVGVLSLATLGMPMGKAQLDPLLIGFFLVVLAVICIGWWRLIRQGQEARVKEQQARPWLLLAFGIVTAVALTLHKLGLVGP